MIVCGCGVVMYASPALCCVQVVADREALREEHEKIQRMVRGWIGRFPLSNGWMGISLLFSQVEEREKMLAGLKKTASDLDTQRKRAQKDVSCLAKCGWTVLATVGQCAPNTLPVGCPPP